MQFPRIPFALGVGLTLPLMLLIAKPAAAQDEFGAIAYSPDDGAQGWAYNYSSRSVAQTRALQECRSYGGNSCQVLVWFKNACGALATTPRGAYGSGWGNTKERAQVEALQVCSKYGNGCRIKRWVCTD